MPNPEIGTKPPNLVLPDVLSVNTGGMDAAEWRSIMKENTEGLQALRKSWVQRATDTARDFLIRFQNVQPNSATVPMTLMPPEPGGSGPQPGEIWIVRAYRIGGITPGTSVTLTSGRWDLYQSPTDPNFVGAGGSTANWIDGGTTLPVATFRSEKQIVLRSPDAIYFSVTACPNNTQIVANLQVECYREGSYKSEVIL